MRSLGIVRDLLFILFAIYYAQGSLYNQGSIISRIVLTIILLISTFYLIKTLFAFKKKPLFYKAWTTLLIVNTIGFFIFGKPLDPLHYEMFKAIVMTSLTFYPFYYFSQNETLNSKHLIRFFVVMLPITILQYDLNASNLLDGSYSVNENLVNNISYSFVALIPFTFLFKRKNILAIGAISIIIFFIVQGAKRGALIAGAIGILYFVYYQLRISEKEKRYK